MKILITGATSFIGLNLIIELLNSTDCFIYAVLRTHSKKDELVPVSNKLIKIYSDTSEYGNLSEKVDNVDAVVHLAWNGTRGQERNNAEIQKENYNMSVMMLDIAKRLEAKVFVGAGSQAEYGVVQGTITENTLPQPVTEYGKQKLAFFQYAMNNKENMRYIEPRYFSLYGQGDFEGTMIISMLKKMLKNETCDLSPCTQNWNFLHIKDAVRGVRMLIENSKCEGAYNFGDIKTYQLKHYIEIMKQVTASKSILNYGAMPFNDAGELGINPCVEKLVSIGWQPQISFEEGIREMYIKLYKGGQTQKVKQYVRVHYFRPRRCAYCLSF